MKAMGFYKYGGPEAIEPLEVDAPKPGDGEVVVRVACTSVNRLDILVRSGYHNLKLKMPHIPGTDMVGRVEEIGKNVSTVAVGDLVISNNLYGCGKCGQCLGKNEVLCREWTVPGMHVWGAYSELVKLPSSIVVEAPKDYSVDELGSMTLNLPVMWRCINTLAMARRGESIAIRAASGNSGLFAVLISKALGLEVIALSRSEDKRERLLKLGAGHVIDQNLDKNELTGKVLEATGGKGADIVIDPLGETLADSVAIARNGGRVVSLGVLGGTQSTIDVKSLYLKNVKIIGMHNTNMQDFIEAFDFASQNKIKPIIAQRLPMGKAREAQEILARGDCFGKIVLSN
ncbi:MAG: zinc-binding dehydrogenase [Candidatus Micrarchaeota archaeon]|nr:zinc-binding dehydrogenase [Candidatus Micrarchaeota archaeon]MDE1848370.1 zinc-binding dehydrogenase [Candidatus Micrarchaeota archaeon]MDE1864807.1 zinc-binding dehydrogenase [Candidatus Micrarchaeota archaeon]